MEEVIKQAGIEDFRKNLTKALSGGWKQRLALGCAILHKPRIIFLDEPTSGVDPITRANFWSIIKEMASHGVTVFVTTHYMDEAENCDRMTLIYKGTIIALGTPEEMKTKIMTDEILEVLVPDPEGWTEKLSSAKGVKDAALFSSTIHIVVESAKVATSSIEGILKDGGVKKYSIRKIKPSLEDVFVSSIEKYDREHPTK
jgi:ABC-2 type transport system ATP-binding protein